MNELKEIAVTLLRQAKEVGTTQAEVTLCQESGFSANVRMGELDTLEHHRGKSLSLTVYLGQRSGSVSTTDFSASALQTTLAKACNIARYTEDDPYAGLADVAELAFEYPNLDLYHPWHIIPEQAIEMALECEAIARESNKRITNSEGASVSTHSHYYVYANSHDFLGNYASSYHVINCALIAQHGHEMECDSDYTVARDPQDLLGIPMLAKNAAQRTAQRLGARKITTHQAPVIFSAEVARGLLSHFLSAISGGSLYRKSSFLLNYLNKSVFPAHIQITENPHVHKGIGSAPFDQEGVKTQVRHLIQDGILQSYLLSSYSARKLGMKTTGNAGGAHNVYMQSSDQDLTGLMKIMDTGLLVTSLMGQGVNIVTGDYSRGAFGYWVEHGEIQHPVHGVTIAGNLKEMFTHLVKVGNDVDHRGNIHTGSILLEQMMIAGD